MWKVWMIALLVAVFATLSQARSAQASNGKDDEVFLDMGDGDFGEMPKAQQPAHPERPAAPAKKKSAEKADANPVKAAPVAAEETAESGTTESKETPGEERQEALPVKKAPTGPHSKFGQNNKKNTEKTKDAGLFVTTKVPCPMHREPASDSEKISTTKAPRKIWVQKVDENWVKAYTKTGEPGYLNTECFEAK